MSLNILNLGTMEYDKVLRLQEKVFDLRKNNEIEDTLIVVEHPPTITLGRDAVENECFKGSKKEAERQAKVFHVNRGGRATFHGLGQGVFYPIIHLKNNNLSIHTFVYTIENMMMDYLKTEHDLSSYCEKGEYTGVWIKDKKIMALGLYIRKNITMHGFAFNINTDLSYFNLIVPCGLQDRGITSLQQELGHPVNLKEAMSQITHYFCRAFRFSGKEISLNELGIEELDVLGA